MPTPSPLTSTFEWIAHDPRATPDVILLIAAIFVAFLIALVVNVLGVRAEIRALAGFLASGNVYAIAAQLLERDRSGADESPLIPGLNPSWAISQRFAQYYEGLLPDADGGDRPRAARPAAELLDPDAVTREAINVRLFHSIPNVLVGIGLLFTFLGLTSALYFATQGSTAASVAATQASVHNLLDAASFKFGSSLAALSLSIVFLFIERLLLRDLQIRLLRVTGTLDRLFPPITIEELLRSQLSAGQMKKSAESVVASARTAIVEALDPSGGSAAEQLKAFLADVRSIKLETDQQTALMTRFGESIADSISRSLDSTLGFRISQTFGQLDTTIARIGDAMQSAHEQVLQRILDDFLRLFEARTRDSFTTMVDASTQYANTVTASGDTLDSALTSAGNVAIEITRHGRDFAALLIEARAGLGDLLERSKLGFGDMTAAAEALTKSQEAAAAMLRQLNEAQERATGAVSTLAITVKALEDAIARSAEASRENSADFVARANATNASYRDTLTELNEGVRESLFAMTLDVTRITDTLQSLVSSTEQARANSLREMEALVERLERRSTQRETPANGQAEHANSATPTIPTVRGEM